MYARLCVVLFVFLCGCAASQRADRAHYSDTVIIEAEILACSDASTAYDLIWRLRPSLMFRATRGVRRNYPVVVYLNNMRLVGVKSLELISARGLREIRYLDPGAATVRYGTGHAAGVFVITFY